MSINTQLQFQDDNKKHERGVFILELQIGKTYILTEDEKSDVTGTVFIKKGSRVRIKTLGSSLALVQDLSAHKNSDGIWSVKVDKLVTPEEYEKMLMDDEVNIEQESPSFGVGDICIMKRPEVSGDGRITYLKKGARVRIEDFGRGNVLVQDLSDDMVGDGVWMTHASYLMPLEDALIVGDTYYMGEAETNSRGNVTFIQKGALVCLLEVGGKDRVVVQDLSEAKRGDGCWYTDPIKLIPIEKPTKVEEADTIDKNNHCIMNDKNKVVEPMGALVVFKNKHYVSDHQPIETMQSNMTHDEMIGFLKGNIIKYACRCGKKDEPLKEAEKIKQYAEWLCIVLSGGTINPRS